MGDGGGMGQIPMILNKNSDQTLFLEISVCSDDLHVSSQPYKVNG